VTASLRSGITRPTTCRDQYREPVVRRRPSKARSTERAPFAWLCIGRGFDNLAVSDALPMGTFHCLKCLYHNASTNRLSKATLDGNHVPIFLATNRGAMPIRAKVRSRSNLPRTVNWPLRDPCPPPPPCLKPPAPGWYPRALRHFAFSEFSHGPPPRHWKSIGPSLVTCPVRPVSRDSDTEKVSFNQSIARPPSHQYSKGRCPHRRGSGKPKTS